MAEPFEVTATLPYADEARLRAAVDAGGHRGMIGGLWDELGTLQLEFLRAEGLLPRHRFVDIGCGALRAGVKLAPYLDAGNYHGVDVSAALLESGRRELELAGVSERVPDANLRVSGAFDLSGFPAFDFGIAQSVFTHLPPQALGACLEAIAPHFRPEGRFYATFFIAPAHCPALHHERGGVTSYADADPFHITVEAIAAAAEAAGWRARWIGEWGHPRDQQICAFAPNA